MNHVDPPRFAPVADPRPEDTPWAPMTWPLAPETALRGRIVDLRPVDPAADVAELFAALDKPRVWDFLKSGAPADEGALRRRLGEGLEQGMATFAVRLSRRYRGFDEGALVGMTAYLDAQPGHARLEIGSTLYAPEMWASGVNPDAKLLLLGHAFEVLGAGRVHLVTDARNHRSQQAIARLGATFEGALRRYERRADGTARDTVMFSIIAEDWPTVKARLEARVAAALGADGNEV